MTDLRVVTVAQFGGKIAEMVVVQDLGEVFLLTKPEEWHTAQQEKREPISIGFSKKYVIDGTVNVYK